ncbi:hypothetical protein [Oscillibacter sp.]|jgi:hypothetical protein|uniref:hypothetical protein n=1 Tax=Oscillibacter sp. TaxID=1945593 RepID=UPI0028994660|nr:hypothetical protein [Oscillibacter sp.]
MNTKVYVPVITAFDSEGRMQPFRIRWEDGEVYKIDRVLDVRPAPALKAGGQGDRYTIQINGKQSYLFFETSTDQSGPVKGRWFVERRDIGGK